ncbi:MAG TPA: glycine betaine ABC transporter substrate-binding protein [Gemmataceae bacterium]|nr:glycine betaine ABC transporter substrate-binding protein [Gemmataceae bacterium]
MMLARLTPRTFLLSVIGSWALVIPAGCSRPDDRPVVVGSKKFTESVILGEMGLRLARTAGAPARHDNVGASPVLWMALTQGDIDVYPEYTGTIAKELLRVEPAELEAALARHGIRMSRPLGFRNNYALGMRKDVAAAKGVSTISDLARHPELRLGFLPEFIDREDGWKGLKPHYGLPQAAPRGLDHTLAYQALAERAIDVMEMYTTDAEIVMHDLLVLADDRRFFPTYEAIWLYRADLEQRYPAVVAELRRLEGRIDEPAMQRLNATVKRGETSEPRAAAEFLNQSLAIPVGDVADDSLGSRLLRTTGEHLLLVVPSLLAAVAVGVPIGVLAARRPRLGQVVLAVTGVVQTIPSLALLLFMIPLMKLLLDRGTGAAPAVAALFLYSLLPIARNTVAGLRDVPVALRESAAALGLPGRAILWRVELPLAARTILAGVKTATVINVGTATLGGFIGAGGYGRPILRGIDKLDVPLMLEGAIPAALMALAAQGLFELVERRVMPPG